MVALSTVPINIARAHAGLDFHISQGIAEQFLDIVKQETLVSLGGKEVMTALLQDRFGQLDHCIESIR